MAVRLNFWEGITDRELVPRKGARDTQRKENAATCQRENYKNVGPSVKLRCKGLMSAQLQTPGVHKTKPGEKMI